LALLRIVRQTLALFTVNIVKYVIMVTLPKRKFKIHYNPKNKITNITKLPFLNLVYLSILINVGVIVTLLLLKRYIPPEVPIFYGLPEGKNQLGSMEQLIIPSMVSLMVILVNISTASLLQNDYLKRVLIIVSLIITLLSLITSVEITLLIGSF
jgi:hypothetical protein